MSLTPPAPSPSRRQIPLSLFAVAVILVAAVSIGTTAAYFEFHPSTPSVGGGNQPTVVSTIPVGTDPEGLAYDPALGLVFVANTGSDNVSVISDTTAGVVATIPVGDAPSAVTYDPNDSEIFVTNSGSNSVSVFSVFPDSNYNFVATVDVGDHPAGVTYDPTDGEAFVANEGSHNVSVISNVTDTVVATIGVGDDPTGIAYDFALGEVFVANAGSDTVSLISTAANATEATIAVGTDPVETVYDAATSEVLVTNEGSNNVTVISDATNRTVAALPVGTAPAGATPDTAKSEFFVANAGSDNVSDVSDASDRVVASLSVGRDPDGLVYDSGKGEVFVANAGSGSVTVISDTSNVVVTDDLGRVVTVPLDPQRVVVLAPSVMDIVYRLGLRSSVVGIGCTPAEPGGIYSEYSPSQITLWSLSNASCVTDYPELDTGGVALLGPQLVLAATITSAQAVDELSDVFGIPVVLLAPASLQGIVSDVRLMGEIFPESLSHASQLESTLDGALANASALDSEFATDHVALPSVLLTYYFDSSAYYTYGPGSFGDSLIALAGGVNVAASVPLQYLGLNATVALDDQPQFILYGTSNDTYLVSGETPSVWSSAPYWSQLTGSKIPLDVTLTSEADPTMILALPLLMHDLHPSLVPPP